MVAGTAGLILGHAILAPGPLRRIDALRLRGAVALELALGAAGMLAVAALIEGFWSAEPFPPAVKYTVAAFLWLSVVAYLGLAGRRIDLVGGRRIDTVGGRRGAKPATATGRSRSE